MHYSPVPLTRWSPSTASSILVNSISVPSACTFTPVPLTPASSTPPSKAPAAKSNCTTPPNTENPFTDEPGFALSFLGTASDRGAFCFHYLLSKEESASRGRISNSGHGSRLTFAGGLVPDCSAQNFF